MLPYVENFRAPVEKDLLIMSKFLSSKVQNIQIGRERLKIHLWTRNNV